MDKSISAVYVAIQENRVVLFDTNLKEFCGQLNKLEPDSRNYDYYFREFKKSDIVKYVSPTDKLYILQKVL